MLYGDVTSTSFTSVQTRGWPHLLRASFVLAPFQRGQVWTPEQQVALCETVWHGCPVPPIVLWLRPHPIEKWPAMLPIVLDGQQRLCALGARVYRHDGARCRPTAARMDLETGRWSVNGPGHTFAELTDPSRTTRAHRDAATDPATREAADRDFELMCHAMNRIDRMPDVALVTIGASATPTQAAEVFARWNTPGVAMGEGEAAEMVRAADALDLSWFTNAHD